MKKSLLDFDIEELQLILKDLPKYRAGQIYKWLHGGADFDDMTDIPKDLKEKLKEEYTAQPLTIHKNFKSNTDNTQKFLYLLSDGVIIEGVLMSYSYGNTLCVSTQAGCRMGCAFCASGKGGLERNLTAGEILGQAVAVNKYLGGSLKERKITNIVLMGSGEPLDNYQNVTKFIRLANSENGLNISQRNISLSTCGIAPAIKKLADDGFSVTLTLSLHSCDQAERQKIMPVAKSFSLDEIKEALKYYFNKTGRRVILEYTMIKGKNMSARDASLLARFAKGFPAHINLIMLNKIKESDLESCTREEAEQFAEMITKLGASVTIRRTLGSSVEGSCGQLRAKFKNP